jgi:bis(5'-nucleosidyl)-tetraphosphatase
MHQVKSCGVILFREQPFQSFLLMKHPNRLDLPKGHVEAGEDEIGCALRELEEETGIPRDNVVLEPGFRFETTYYPRYQQFNGERVEKTVVIFLARLKMDMPILLIEHSGYEWVIWNPPHRFYHGTIDLVLLKVARYIKQNTHSSDFSLPLTGKKNHQKADSHPMS